MNKTIKEKLENRIAELQQYKEEVRIDDWPEVGALSASIRELQQVLKMYNQQCEEILAEMSKGNIQNVINHLGYTERKCIEFAEWVSKEGYEFSESLGDIWMNRQGYSTTSQGLYQNYESAEKGRESSTEAGE